MDNLAEDIECFIGFCKFELFVIILWFVAKFIIWVGDK